MDDCREAVGDDERSAVLYEGIGRARDEPLALGVEMTGRFIEYQYLRISQDRSGYADPLALAAGKLDAAFADDRIVSLFKLRYEYVRQSGAGGPFYLVSSHSFAAVGYILSDSARE